MHPIELLKSLFCLLKPFTIFLPIPAKMFSTAYQIVERNFQNLMGYERTCETEKPARFLRFKI